MKYLIIVTSMWMTFKMLGEFLDVYRNARNLIRTSCKHNVKNKKPKKFGF